jgi:hypothetical protein
MPTDDDVDQFMTWVGGPLLVAAIGSAVIGMVGCAVSGVAGGVTGLFLGFLGGYVVGLVVTVPERRERVALQAERVALFPPKNAVEPKGPRKCIECGKLASSTLTSCPHCGKSVKGILCRLCGNCSRESELGTAIGIVRYHTACIERLLDACFKQLTFAMTCPECSYVEQWSSKHPLIIQLLNHSPDHPCPSCGRMGAFDYLTCSLCGLLIYPSVQPYCSSVWNGAGERVDTRAYHYPTCSPAERPPGRYLMIYNSRGELKQQIGKPMRLL